MRPRYPVTLADLLDLATAAVVAVLTIGPPLAALILYNGG